MDNIKPLIKLILLYFIVIFVLIVTFISLVISVLESQQELLDKQTEKIEYLEKIVNDLNQF